MKKMLALVLVLGLASLASAAITLQQDSQSGIFSLSYAGGMLTISASSAVPVDPFIYVGLQTSGSAVISDTGWSSIHADTTIFAGTPLSGTLAGANGIVAGIGTTGTTSIGSGNILWNIAISGIANGDTIKLGLLNDNWDGYNQVYYTGTFMVPEPATMSILALGGLLLRRKK